MLRHALPLTFVALFAVAHFTTAAEPAKDNRLYQLRTYYTAPEKLSVLIDRFQEHNLPIFERHGIKLEGAWVPVDPGEEDERLVYLVSFPNREAADKAWQDFSNDPQWMSVFGKEKEVQGTVVEHAETVYLTPTDYSPMPSQAAKGAGHLYELRTYTASPGKMANLNTRFRDHTVNLFKKHGMTNILYTEPVAEEKGAGETLVYFLAFPDRAAADQAWAGFRNDPVWQKAMQESQADGVKLAAVVKSVFLKPLGFSPLK